MSRKVPQAALWDRYTRLQGRVHLTGLQAIVRLTLDQVRRDRAEGRRVGVVVSGYPGSPLAGLDRAFSTVGPLLAGHDVRLVPGLNEELAASTVGGTQLLDLFPHSGYDGAVGIWYGKAPGLDRSLDAIRHCNFMGTSRHGGVLAVVGDDPGCKSSSLPSHSEYAFAHAFVPLLSPSNSEDVLELGLHGVALSRYSGLWVGLRVVADVADGGGTLELPTFSPELPKLEIDGSPFRPALDTGLLPPHVNRIEEDLILRRLEAVRAYARANKLNRIVERHAKDRIGIIAAGWLFPELLEALDRLGLDAGARESAGIRLLNLRLVYPVDERLIVEFAEGLEQIIVVDERRGFVEEQIRAALVSALDPPRVVGQRDERGEPWLARIDQATADVLAVSLGPFLGRHLERRELEERARELSVSTRSADATSLGRPPHFCSGCPHSVSTLLPAGAVAGGGIGCHTMALLMDRGVKYVGAMGSEGAHWIGLSPFVDTPHLFQNLGDGTYFHSGRLAVRACVEAGTSITFKLLFNGRIAMTGGQHAVGEKPVIDVVHELLSDGVRRVIVVSSEPALRALARRHRSVECIDRAAYGAAMEELSKETGVTALIYDELCSNEKQRQERRGLRERPGERLTIHEDVCEGCGDCGARSACLSLHPVPTSLGRKTRIHNTSCTDDRSCLLGDCPAFLSVSTPQAPPRHWSLDEALPPPPVTDPPPIGDDPFRIFLVGIGSTGVVTVNALLVRAAELDGYHVRHLDQTGLSQRGGRVISHCLISRQPWRGSPRVGWGRADTLLAFDPLGACDSTGLAPLSRSRTRAIVHSSVSPTASMVAQSDAEPLEADRFVDILRGHTRKIDAVPAELLAEAVFGSTLNANTIQLGFAHQAGAVPLRLESLEQAIIDRGVAVDQNLAALRLGRATADDPELLSRILEDATPPSIEPRPAQEARAVFGESFGVIEQALGREGIEASTIAERIAGFALDLVDYQSRTYARRYLDLLSPVARCGESHPELTETAARELYRLMAYKDEYEVARLLLRGPFRRWLDRRASSPRVRYHLQPPLLRALGLNRKLAFGRWIEPGLRALVSIRRIRGTVLDAFGHTETRRLERDLIDWYGHVLKWVANAGTENRSALLEIAGASSRIRGFEKLKCRRAREVRERVTGLMRAFET